MSKKSKASSAKKTPAKATKPTKAKSSAKKIVKKISKPLVIKKTAAKKPIKKTTPPKKSKAKKIIAPPKVSTKKPVKAPAKNNVKPVAKKAVAPTKTKKVKQVKAVIHKPILAAVKQAPKKEIPAPKVEKPAEKVVKPIVETKADLPKVMAVSNNIPKTQVASLSLNKIASISRSITNPVKKSDSYSVKPEKEPAGKFELEIPVRSSPEMLYEFLFAPSGLSEWFCDDVNIRNGIYTFIWEGQMQQARLLKTVDNHLVRFQWVDKTDGSYFEFKIQRDDLTNDISLIITDFADTASERESGKLLWQSQVEKLMHIIGSIF